MEKKEKRSTSKKKVSGKKNMGKTQDNEEIKTQHLIEILDERFKSAAILKRKEANEKKKKELER